MKIPAIIETHEANLSIEELEKIAEDVRLIITRGKGLTLREYIERANIVSAWELGCRKTKALQFESKLEAYFPDEVFAILKLKWKTVLGQQFNDDDNEFFKVNASKGAIWLADRFYTNRNHMHDRLVKMGLISEDTNIAELAKLDESKFPKEEIGDGMYNDSAVQEEVRKNNAT